MDLIDKAIHKGKKLTFEYNGNYYSQASKRLRKHSSKIQEYISFCEDKLSEINVEVSESYGEVIDDFQEGIRAYKARISSSLEDALRKKESIDRAADEAYEKAEKYYSYARYEDEKSKED